MAKGKDYTEMSKEELESQAEKIMDAIHALSDQKAEIREEQLRLHKEYEPVAQELAARAAGGSQISPEGIESTEEVGNIGG